MSAKPAVPRLMLVTDRRRMRLPLREVVAQAVAGGVDAVQIREKDLSMDELAALALDVRDIVGFSAILIINGAPPVAARLGLSLHLPETAEFSAAERSVLAPTALLGRSVHSPESAGTSDAFDYLVAGQVFQTPSKRGRQPIGPEGLASIAAASPRPVLAIGGITPERVAEVLAAGARGVAIMSGIGASAAPEESARAYRAALDGEIEMTDTKFPRSGSLEAQVNGKPVILAEGMTVARLLQSKGLHETMVVVEHNGTILKRKQFAEAEIADGDVLEVVHFVGGG